MGWEEQGTIFVVGYLCGTAIGIGADGYRAWQSAVRPDRMTIIAIDCFLWCALAAVVFSLMLLLNGGDMRTYVFLALVLGYLIYRRLMGDRILRLWLWCAMAVCTIGRYLRRIIITLCLPICWCCRVIVRSTRRIMRWLSLIRKSPPEKKS